MSLYWLWSRERSWPILEHKAFLDTWLPKDHSQSYLWGEGAVPQYLAQYWYFSSVDPTWKSEGQLGSLLFALSLYLSPWNLRVPPERRVNKLSVSFALSRSTTVWLPNMVPSYNDCLEGTSTSCRTGYKEGATDYPSPGCSRLGNYHARAPSI
jgi:hypothetical protein